MNCSDALLCALVRMFKRLAVMTEQAIRVGT